MGKEENTKTPSSRPTIGHRYSAPRPDSSAFSASAFPNEDWTKISDLRDRRRIQNRIAQRNYRKKLKTRVEKAEEDGSASPEPAAPRNASTRQKRASPGSSSAPLTKTQDTENRASRSPKPSYIRGDQPSYLELPDDRHLSHAQPSFSYTYFGHDENNSETFPNSPTLSSYSVPSPSLSALSYDNSSYFSASLTEEYAVSPCLDSGYGNTEWTYDPAYTEGHGYEYQGYDEQKRHMSAAQAGSFYPEVTHSLDFHDYTFMDDALHGSSDADRWHRPYQTTSFEKPFVRF